MILMMMRGDEVHDPYDDDDVGDGVHDPYDDDADVGDCDQRVLPGGGGGNVGHQPRHLLQV
jgi:hypothetical protein